jgi:hypothetical protein
LSVRHDRRLGWVVDAGRVHGITRGSEAESTVLALFPNEASIEGLESLARARWRAEVSEVLPHVSRIRFQGPGEPARDEVFKALVIQVPLVARAVRLDGDAAALDPVRLALATATFGEAPSLFVREARPAEDPALRLEVRHGDYLISRPGDDWPLALPIRADSPGADALAVGRLEHITRWENTCYDLRNAHGRIRPDEVELTVEADGKECRDTAIRLAYEPRPEGGWNQPTFRVKLSNRGQRPLYCALLVLSDDFRITADLLTGGGTWLYAGQEVWALNGEPIYASVPKDLWEQGVTEFHDVLKLIVSTQAFDATLLEQEKLDRPPRTMRAATRIGGSTLNRLMARVQTRSFDRRPQEDETYDDWTTDEVSFVTVWPLDLTKVPSTGDPVRLSEAVLLEPHPNLRARARLTTLPQATRGLGNLDLPGVLKDDAELSRPLLFTPSRGGDPGLQVLELTDVEDYLAVTPVYPLRLRAGVALAEGECVLPVAFDSEFFLPLGYAEPLEGVGALLTLERLPHPVAQRERSLGGAIRIFFQKILSRTIGTRYEYPLIGVAEADGAKQVRYDHDPAHVRARVAQASRILLLLHGIIGDTRAMAGCAWDLGQTSGGAYDLVLTYDYESLNTPIETLAAGLADRLAAAGLGHGHGKALDIVAHSMGGLVSRWFIERGGGDRDVRRLVMLGTPNAGSPWPTLKQWATVLVTVGLNMAAPLAWPAKLLTGAVALLRPMTLDLGQMRPGADLLRTLADSSDPGIPYVLVAGDTGLIGGYSEGERGRLRRLLDLLMTRDIVHAAADPFFLGAENDIAVSVESMRSVPSGRRHELHIEKAACDHLSYFTSASGREALRKALAHHDPAAAPPGS